MTLLAEPQLETQSALELLDGRTKDWGPGYSVKLDRGGYGLSVVAPDKMDIDRGRMSIWVTYADGSSRDGVGDLLEVTGIDLTRHRKNPIGLFDHGKDVKLPIALTEDRDTGEYVSSIDPVSKTAKDCFFFYQGTGIKGLDRQAEYDHALFCQQLFDLCDQGFIRGGSIGYQVKQASPIPANYAAGTPPGLHLLQVLKLESSIVVLPANGDTVRKMLALPKCCGKPLSPWLVKSLSAVVPERTKTVSGYEERLVKSVKWFALVVTFKDGTTSKRGPFREGSDLDRNLRWYQGQRDVTSVKVESSDNPDDPDYLKSYSSNHLESRTDHDNPLSRGGVPPAKWRPGQGAVKALRAKYKASMPMEDWRKRAVAKVDNSLKAPMSREVGKLLDDLFVQGLSPDEAAKLVNDKYRARNGEIGVKSLDIRRKYARLGSLRRRTKCGSPGSAIVHVAGKDLQAVESECLHKGVGFARVGVKGDLERVRLTGDDKAIDGIAGRFGQRVKSLGKRLFTKKLEAVNA